MSPVTIVTHWCPVLRNHPVPGFKPSEPQGPPPSPCLGHTPVGGATLVSWEGKSCPAVPLSLELQRKEEGSWVLPAFVWEVNMR